MRSKIVKVPRWWRAQPRSTRQGLRAIVLADTAVVECFHFAKMSLLHTYLLHSLKLAEDWDNIYSTYIRL